MLFAILLGTGVLLGCAAITIDTGALLYERRQLQNGADAAALSIAQTCLDAEKLVLLCSAPDISGGSTLVNLAGANAVDQKSDIASVCASTALHAANPIAFPTICAVPAPSGLVECSPTTGVGKYVEVRTSTRAGTGSSTILPPILARTLAGGSYTGETVKACARVAWGPTGPPATVYFPVTFSYCDWLAQTGANPLANPIIGHYEAPPFAGHNPGYDYSTPPDTQWPPDANEKVMYTAGHGSLPCATWNGHVAPGNFGTLENVGCNSTVVDGWVRGDTGNSAPCDSTILAAQRGKIIYIPIFDCDSSTWNNTSNCTSAHGSHDWYHISGYAAFYLTGFYFSGTGNDGASIFPPNGAKPCSGSDRCVSGWFTTGVIQATVDNTGAPPFGSYAVQLSG